MEPREEGNLGSRAMALTADPPDGIKVFPNEEDLTDLQVTIEGPGESGYLLSAHSSVFILLWLHSPPSGS